MGAPRQTWIRGGAGARPVAAPLDPRLRASTADRQRYADILGQAYAVGQLDDAEFARRVETALSATYLGDLLPLTADLNPAGLGLVSPAAPPATAVTPVPARPLVPAKPRGRHRVAKIVTAVVAAGAVAFGGLVVVRSVLGSVTYYAPVAQAAPGPGGYYPGGFNGGDYQPFAYDGPASALPPGIQAGGSADIDLSRVTMDRSTILRVSVDSGNARLVLPHGNVVVQYHTSAIAGGVGDVVIVGTGHDDRTGPDAATGEVRGTYTGTPFPGDPVITVIAELSGGGNLDIIGD